MEFKVGDIVKVKGQPPALTITRIEDGTASCTWFYAGAFQKETFDLSCLEHFLGTTGTQFYYPNYAYGVINCNTATGTENIILESK